MQDHKSYQVGKNAYIIKQYDPKRAAKVFAQLLRVLGPSLGALLQEIEVKPGSSKKEVMDSAKLKVLAVVPAAIRELTSNLDDEAIDKLFDSLTDCVLFAGSPITGSVFTAHFTGNLKGVQDLFMEVVRYQFADFFGGLFAALEK